jgi:hypothetical protein
MTDEPITTLLANVTLTRDAHVLVPEGEDFEELPGDRIRVGRYIVTLNGWILTLRYKTDLICKHPGYSGTFTID